MIIAQISDLHVRPPGALAYGRVPTNTMLEAAVSHLNGLASRPDIVVATGDLVDGGSAVEYAELRRILEALSFPVYLVPGNHDERANLRAAFADHPYLPRDGAFLRYVVEEHPVRLVALDTLVPGAPGGRLCAERLAWLAAALDAAPERPTVLLMHHPPFRTHIRHMDEMGLDGAEGLGALVERHPQIERILCGHIHRPIQVRWRGTLASTAPSTAHQVALDLDPGGAARFAFEPPGCQLHVWSPGTGLVSHMSYIGRYDGPYPFH